MVIKKIVHHGTRPLLDKLIGFAPQCIHHAPSVLVPKYGPVSYSARQLTLRDQVYFRGATTVTVNFHNLKTFHCDTLILSTSFDMQKQRVQLKYSKTPLDPLTFKGSRLYIQYVSDQALEETKPWNFTVSASCRGFHDVAFMFLSTFIELVGHDLPGEMHGHHRLEESDLHSELR